ncbi:MAG: DUF1329 domain-containing protein [Deltaproteobacteria bacterium]|nr:DUF1329 domain-containing protein [Deltaproteobacteria bacterium]
MKQKRTVLILSMLISLLMLGAHATVMAGVSAEKAAKLNTTLTPFGAERAGNADGTIPAWEEGITEVPAGYEPGKRHIDPYANDQVLYTITAANMDKYADKLAEGSKELLKRYPDTFRLDVYQTRRSFSAPQWVYDNTIKNATRAGLSEDGYSVSGAFGGIAFPIPKRPEEVMWNFLTRYYGKDEHYSFDICVISPNSKPVIVSGSEVRAMNPYYDQDLGIEDFYAKKTPEYFLVLNQFISPPRRKGEVILGRDPLDQSKNSRKAWQYLPGQRRVRRAPTIAYDTPNPGASGLMTYDDVFMFNGALDRYDWKLIGKKEVYIPYNCYKAETKASLEELCHAHHPNPEYWRWELHRVWVVEGSLKSGKRHVYAKRVNYIDEDSWSLAIRDVYDAQGSLWRHAYAGLKNAYELPGVVDRPNVYIDFYRPEYLYHFSMTRYDRIPLYNTGDVTEKYFTPEKVRRLGKR